MARRNRNLAGLAALGALGYALARGNAPRTDGGAPVEDRRGTPVEDILRPAATAGFEDTRGFEGGIEPLGLRRNEETGDLYDPTGRVLNRPTAATRPAVARRRVPPASLLKTDEDFPSAKTFDQALAEAAPGSKFTYRGKTYEKEPADVSGRRIRQEQPSTGLTLGTPIRPDPRAPSIYAGPEAWAAYRKRQAEGMKKGGAVKAKPKKMASGGMTSASKRADGIATKGKTKCKMY